MQKNTHLTKLACVCLLASHFVLSANLAFRRSPTADELAHIAGGLVIWEYGRFDLYCVNPPLTRLLGSLPAYLYGTKQQWTHLQYEIQDHPEFNSGAELAASHPHSWRKFLVCGRLMLLTVSMIGGLICFKWANRIYGTRSALLAVSFWSFSPNLLCWNSIIGSDGIAASLGITAAYFFWKWYREPTWQHAIFAGGVLGLAQLSKTSWIILFPLWFLLGAWQRGFCESPESRRIGFSQLAVILVIGVYIINAGYGFDGSMKRLADYQFFSSTLAGQHGHEQGGNRFSQSLIGRLPVPVPEFYLRGIDLQKVDFEVGKPSYLLGEWKNGGWWYYYLVGVATKVPVGTLCFAFLTLFLSVRVLSKNLHGSHRYRPYYSLNNILLVLAPMTLFVFVSLQDGIGCHFRYVLPAFPFAFVWISQTGTIITEHHSRWWRALVVFLLTATISSSLSAYPHVMSFFNVAAGGPKNGHKIMLSSSYSWGEDIFDLERWLRRHGIEEIPFINVYSPIPFELFEIPSRGMSPKLRRDEPINNEVNGPTPGLHIIGKQFIEKPSLGYGYFRDLEPIDHINYSINVYRLTIEEANRLRGQLGLQAFEVDNEDSESFIERLSQDSQRNTFPSVAVFVDSTSPVPEKLAECLLDENWETIGASDIAEGRLDQFDVVVFPGGSATEQARALGAAGKRSVQEYVSNGGGYLGLCAGAFLGSSGLPHSLSLVNADIQLGDHFVPGTGYKSWIDRGRGDVNVVMTEAGRTALGENFDSTQAPHLGGPVFHHGKHTYLVDYVTLARYESELYRYEFQKGRMIGSGAIIAAPFGRGKVILAGAHFEAESRNKELVNMLIKAVAR